jgi:hypothetical protein
LPVLNKFNQVEFFKFGQISMDLTYVTVDETGGLADTVRAVLDDRTQEFKRFWSGDTVDISRIVIYDFEMGVRCFALIEGSEGIFEAVITTLLEPDMERTVGRVGVTSRGHAQSPLT